jgi:hypothetical protein
MKSNKKTQYTKRGPINENRASFSALKDQLKDVDKILLSSYEKELDREEKMAEKHKNEKNIEEFILSVEKQRGIINKLVSSLERKVDILKNMKTSKDEEYQDSLERGVNIFKNVMLKSFDNLKYKKGQRIEFKNKSYSLALEKSKDDANVYTVLKSNIQNVQPQDVVKADNFSMGENAKITLYKLVGDKYQQVSSFEIKGVVDVVLDPEV